jgi:hypothetical protein
VTDAYQSKILLRVPEENRPRKRARHWYLKIKTCNVKQTGWKSVVEWIKTARSSLLWQYVINLWFVSSIFPLCLVFTPILYSRSHIILLHHETFQSYNSLLCSLITCLSLTSLPFPSFILYLSRSLLSPNMDNFCLHLRSLTYYFIRPSPFHFPF